MYAIHADREAKVVEETTRHGTSLLRHDVGASASHG